ncbi:Crp/Fnr family transcriptional regulator [Dyadobacter sp. CY345]|uniref:Crp/Fnr family transcriptional regulator n=1 Tax=Dyadobacter sp. CY345 TaxID=2909335 RepID=UPI001F3461F7|nr:Crp/Fnr family transcriptional regulator [Dyadobacter sp. CY345]MCF2443229.1 Crp/Fnr family transcriptional regulator [Dyadobacter sp. CY345]
MNNFKPLQLLTDTLGSSAFAHLKEHFPSMATPYRVRKGRILVNIGQVNDNIYFLHSGVMRSYYIINDEDITSRLIGEGDIACIAESFFTRKKSDEAIEVLEDSLLYSVSYEEYRALAKEDVLISNLIVQMLELRLISFSEKVKLFKFLTVEQRIEAYINHPSSLFRRISDHYIATYLGTTPATFSRCLKSVLRDKKL